MVALAISMVLALITFSVYYGIKTRQGTSHLALLQEQQRHLAWQILRRAIKKSGSFGCYRIQGDEGVVHNHTNLSELDALPSGFVITDGFSSPESLGVIQSDVLTVVYGRHLVPVFKRPHAPRYVVTHINARQKKTAMPPYMALSTCERLDFLYTREVQDQKLEDHPVWRKSYNIENIKPKLSPSPPATMMWMDLAYEGFFVANRGKTRGLFVHTHGRDTSLLLPQVENMRLDFGFYCCEKKKFVEHHRTDFSRLDRKIWKNLAYVIVTLTYKNKKKEIEKIPVGMMDPHCLGT